MERVCTMLSGGRIIRFLIILLACVAVWKVWDYIGTTDKSSSLESPHPAPPKVASNIKKDDPHLLIHQAPADTTHELQVEVESRLVLQVFYEPLCPDSKSFVRFQLAPTMEKIANRIELVLVPYGKAKTFEKGGTLTFQCQHGPTECLGNKVHSCVVKHIQDTALQTKIVSCMIADNYKPKSAAQKCLGKYSPNDYPVIRECFSSDEGDQLLKHMGTITQSLSPALTYVPTVTLDGSQDDMFHVLGNLLSAICKKLKGPLPPACMTPQ